MSKSLKRVIADAEARGLPVRPVRLEEGTLTAQAAADAVGAELDQIVKSVVLRATGGEAHFLFLTAGGNRVDLGKAGAAAGAALEMADAASIRAVTGFAIGGVSPFGHKTPLPVWMDPRILDFGQVWAAAGTPHHVFPIAPRQLQAATGAAVADFTR